MKFASLTGEKANAPNCILRVLTADASRTIVRKALFVCDRDGQT
jgi:hypothetical protein